MDLAILHHFPGGISLCKSSEVSLFSYSSFAFLTPLPCNLNEFIITEQECLDQLTILNVKNQLALMVSVLDY
jgi:hypothetical protein